MINTDKAQKLISKLGAVNEKLENLKAEQDSLVEEITTTLTSPTTPTGKKTATTAGTKPIKKEDLGSRIMTWLISNPGYNNGQIAAAMGVRPAQTGVAMYHLIKSGKVIIDEEGKYFIKNVPLKAAAKTSDTED